MLIEIKLHTYKIYTYKKNQLIIQKYKIVKIIFRDFTKVAKN